MNISKTNGISLVKKHCSQLNFQCALSNANWKHNAKEKWPLKIQLSIKEWKERSESWKNEKVYALVLPVCVRVWVLRWSDRENFLWQVSHWNGLTPTHTQEHTSVVTHTHTHEERTSTGYSREALPKCVRGEKNTLILSMWDQRPKRILAIHRQTLALNDWVNHQSVFTHLEQEWK